MSDAVKEAIRSLVAGTALSGDQTRAAMESIMSGAAEPAQIGAFLVALRMQGPLTVDTVAVSGAVMLDHARAVTLPDLASTDRPVLDLVGTGGDGRDTFNVSTAAAFVVAAAGVRVAKHGNRSSSGNVGSADLLEALGCRLELDAEQIVACVDACNYAFLFAPRFHPAMRHAGPARRQIGVRTVFNVLGPLTNPARPPYQVTGVGTLELGALYGQLLQRAGTRRAVVVHSKDGCDELSCETGSHVWLVDGDAGTVEAKEMTPEDFGVERRHALDLVCGGSVEERARMLRAVFGNEATCQGVADERLAAVRDFIVLNAAPALWIAGKAATPAEGGKLARELIADGRAGAVLERYAAKTVELAVKD